MPGEKLIRWGFLIPSSNTVVESEVFKVTRLLTTGISRCDVVFARIPYTTRFAEDYVAYLSELRSNLVEAARQLSESDVNIVGVACTSMTFDNPVTALPILSALEGVLSGVGIVTAYQAIVELCIQHRFGKVIVLTPYPVPLGAKLDHGLASAGIQVIGSEHLDLRTSKALASLTSDTCVSLARRFQEADALVVGCTNVATLDFCRAVETATGVAVVSSNGALLRLMLDQSGLTLSPNARLGTLFNESRPSHNL